MIKHLIAALLLLSSSLAFAAKEGGTFYSCSNDNVKLTLNLHDQQAGECFAVVTSDGIQKVYNKYKGKKAQYLFLVGTVKDSTFMLKKTAKSAPIISLTTDPASSDSQIAVQSDGLVETKFSATLVVPGLLNGPEIVSCLEVKWTYQ